VFTSNNSVGRAEDCCGRLLARIENNTFDKNHAVVDGGAILCLGGAAVITGNVFDSNTADDTGAAVRYDAAGEITGNVFRNNRNTTGASGAIIIRGGVAVGPSVTVGNNVFHDNKSAIFMRTAPETEILRNTIIRCGAGINNLGTTDAVAVANNVIVSSTGAGLAWSGTAPTVTCNDVWQNVPNYDGMADPTGSGGNISLDPLHCDPQMNDFTLHENSPCASANAGACGMIGAFDAACPPSAVEPATWGGVKAVFGR
jgi:predicted outer membrane repeat protein